MAIPKVLELARKYGKSVREVVAYADNTGHETANDLALWEEAGAEIAALSDTPLAPGKPVGVPTNLDVALTWTAAVGASTYQVRTRNNGRDVYGDFKAGLSQTITTPYDGDFTFAVRGQTTEGVEGPWSPESDVVTTTKPAARKAPVARKTAVKKEKK